MQGLEQWLWLTTLGGFFLGVVSVGWARTDISHRRKRWGQRLFLGTFLILGLSGVIAARVHADGLVPLGILAGFLLVAMLWEK